MPEREVAAIAASVGRYAPPPDGQPATLPVRRMAQVAPEHVEFLWQRRIAFCKLNLIAGIQGEGKSTVLLDLAARMSRGAELPGGGTAPRGASLFFTAEDGLGDTVRPRLAVVPTSIVDR